MTAPDTPNPVPDDELVYTPPEDQIDVSSEASVQMVNETTGETEYIPETVNLHRGHAHVTHSAQVKDKKPKEGDYLFHLPSYTLRNSAMLLRRNDKIPGMNRDSPVIEAFADRQRESTNFYTPGGLYQDLFEDSTQQFEQGIKHTDGRLRGITAPKFKSVVGAELTSDMAVLKVSKALGLGEPVYVPLPHSGIVVTINPPTETDLIDFYTSIFREKIYLGRMTAGMTLTNMSAYINNRLFDFIAKHITAINYTDITASNLRKYMLIHDFPILCWGFASAMHPNGFDFSRDCSFDLSKCTHAETGVINLQFLYWCNNMALTEFQRVTLYEARPKSLTLDTYNKYVAEHSRTKSAQIALNDSLVFNLKVPTFDEHISDGLAWSNMINTAIDTVIVTDAGEEATADARKELLQQYVSASILRQFSHFVDSIEVDGELIQGREAVNKVLSLLSSDDNLRPEISKKIIRFKSDTTLALIGLEEYKCPSCGKPQQEEPVNPGLANVIPIDVMRTFFTLVTLRVSRITARG